MKDYNEFLIESSLSRIWRHVQNHDAGAISGSRDKNTPAQNRKNNREIKAYLLQRGYGVTAVDGSFIENFGSANAKEVKEASFFVVDLKDTGRLERDLRGLGTLYDQDCIMSVEQGGKTAVLIGTSKRDDAYPDYGQVKSVGQGRYGKVAGQYLSRIRGREFTFEDVELPPTRNGKWAMSLVAESVQKRIDATK